MDAAIYEQELCRWLERRGRKVIDELELSSLGSTPLIVDSQQGHFKSNQIVNTQAT